MNSFEIRNASPSDACDLTKMLETLGYPTDEHTLEERLISFTSQNGYGVAVAISEGDLIGFVAWSKSLLFVSSAVRIHIEGIFIDQKHRGFGIGKKLMQHVEEIAKLYSPAIVDLTSGKRREKDGSHEFYKRIGYKNEGLMAKLYLRKEL